MDKFTKQIAVGVGLTVGVIASSVTLYLLLKSDQDEEEEDGRHLVKSSRQATSRIKVPKDSVGAVIGRGGDVIKNIQDRTNTRIKFDDGSESDEERTLVIRGSADDIVEAEIVVKKILANQPIVEEIFIPVSAVGYIIGKNGETIRSMCEASGAKIKIPPNGKKNYGQLQAVVIKGSSGQIGVAKSLINEKLEVSERRSKMKQNNSSRGIPFRERALAIEEGHADEKNKSFYDFQEKLIPTTEDGYVQVFVSSVRNPRKFWIQPFGTKAIELDKLVDDMTDFYEIELNRNGSRIEDLNVGDIVAAPYGHDSNWYRARVVELTEEGYPMEEAGITVYYADFGDEGLVKRKDLCVLSTDFATRLLYQASECSLSNVEAVNGVWSEDAIKHFNEITYAAQWTHILAKPLHQRQTDDSLVTIVELVDPQKESDANIAESLVKNGFARRTDPS